jgi:hypothetical protein
MDHSERQFAYVAFEVRDEEALNRLKLVADEFKKQKREMRSGTTCTGCHTSTK